MFDKIKAMRLAQRARRVRSDRPCHDPELEQARTQVSQGNLEPGRRQLADSRARYESRVMRLGWLAEAAVPYVNELAQLSGENPNDAELALWLGATRITQGWQVRTGQLAKNVSREQFEEFWFILGGSHDPLMRAVELLPEDPAPWVQLQWRGLGLQLERAELDEVWNELLKRDPHLYDGHYSRVQVLCEKWQGSNEEVLDFATTTAANAVPGDPKAALIVVAHLEVALDKRQPIPDYVTSPQVIGPITEIADRWLTGAAPGVHTDEAHHLFGAAFFLADDNDRARRHLGAVDAMAIPSHLPWAYLSKQPAIHYLAVRDSLGL